MEVISIRRAEEDDYEGILAINTEIYRGRDYLPAFFHSMLRNNNILALVACRGKQIVGFTSGLLIDGGKAVIRRCGRIHQSEQHQGLYKNLMLRLRSDLQKIYPTLLSERVVLDDRSAGTSKPSLMETEVFRVSISTFKDRSSGGSVEGRHLSDDEGVHDVNAEQLEIILQDGRVTEVFFPRFLTCFWKPMVPVLENLSDIFSENTRLLSNVEITSGNFSDLNALAFYTSYTCKVGLFCHVDIYGTGLKNLRRQLQEIVLRMLMNRRDEDLYINIYNHASISMHGVEEDMARLNFEKTKAISELIVLDKNIEHMC